MYNYQVSRAILSTVSSLLCLFNATVRLLFVLPSIRFLLSMENSSSLQTCGFLQNNALSDFPKKTPINDDSAQQNYYIQFLLLPAWFSGGMMRSLHRVTRLLRERRLVQP